MMITKTYLLSLGVTVEKWPDVLQKFVDRESGEEKEERIQPVLGVYFTAGNQILGSFSDLKTFRTKNEMYRGWHRHHIVESRDLERLGIASRLPEREAQLCVLLPPDAHCKRINSVLQRTNPNAAKASARDLKGSYHLAYSMMGDYSGGGKELISRELLSVVRETLRANGVL